MFYYVEQWKPRPKWLALTPEDRGKFLFDQSPVTQVLLDAGVQLVGYILDYSNGHPPEGSFLRIWQMPEKELVQLIEEALEKAGWHEFFEPGSARGELLTPQVAIPYLISS